MKGHLVVGLTGSIGSGKSEVAKILQSLGCKIIDADELAREVVAPGSNALKSLQSKFGDSIINQDGALNRKKLGSLIFSDTAAKEHVESILHPLINSLFKKRLAEYKSSQADSIIVYVVPLLFEARHKFPEIEKTVVVSATEEVLVDRIVKRDGCDKEDALRRIRSQLPSSQKEKLADYLIQNDSDLDTLRKRTMTLHKTLAEGAL